MNRPSHDITCYPIVVFKEERQPFPELSDAARLSSLNRCPSTPTRISLFTSDAESEEMRWQKS